MILLPTHARRFWFAKSIIAERRCCPLYEEFVNFCANVKVDHPEIEYQFSRSKTLEGKESVSSVTFENVVSGSEVEKSIDEMILNISDAIASEGN